MVWSIELTQGSWVRISLDTFWVKGDIWKKKHRIIQNCKDKIIFDNPIFMCIGFTLSSNNFFFLHFSIFYLNKWLQRSFLNPSFKQAGKITMLIILFLLFQKYTQYWFLWKSINLKMNVSTWSSEINDPRLPCGLSILSIM